MGHTFREDYERDGYVILKDVFSLEEVKNFKLEVQRILEEVERRSRFAGNKTIGDNDFRKHGVFVGLSANSEMFREAAKEPRIVEALHDIMGQDISFLSDKIVYKNAATDFGSPWHQDWPYWHGSHKVSVWIALDPARPDNGCLKVLPGSHKTIVEHRGDASDGKGFGNRLRPEDVDESRVVTVALEPGSALIFHDLLFHASHPNRSGEDRWAVITTYKDNTKEDPDYEWAVAAFPIPG